MRKARQRVLPHGRITEPDQSAAERVHPVGVAQKPAFSQKLQLPEHRADRQPERFGDLFSPQPIPAPAHQLEQLEPLAYRFFTVFCHIFTLLLFFRFSICIR